MSFTEVDLFGVYVAPIALMICAAWLLVLPIRRAAPPGLLRYVWRPALFEFAIYIFASRWSKF